MADEPQELNIADAAKITVKDGRVHFEGNYTKACAIFFEQHVKPVADAYIASQLNQPPIEWAVDEEFETPE